MGRKISRVASLEKQSEPPQACFSTSSKNEGINMGDSGFHTGFSVWGGGDVVCGIACLMKT